MVFKPVGVDENGKFPERVSTALNATILAKAPRGAVFHHDFSNLTAGAALPPISDSGHAMRYVHGLTSNGALIAGNGGITNGATTGGAAGYLEVELAANVKRVGMWVSFPVGGSGSVVPLVWQQSLADRKLSNPVNNAVPASPLHAPISSRSAALQVWPTDGASAAVTLHSQAYTPATPNEPVYLEVAIDGDTYSTVLPDGTVKTVSSPYIAANAGRFACFEIFQIDAAAGPAPKIIKIWASDDPDASLTQNALLAMGQAWNKAQRPISSAQTNVNLTINATTTTAEVHTAIRTSAVVPPSGKLVQEINAWVNNGSGTVTPTTLFLVPTLYDYTGTGTPLRAPTVQASTTVTSGWVPIKFQHSGLTPGQDVVATWQLRASLDAVASIRADSGTGRNVTATVTPVT